MGLALGIRHATGIFQVPITMSNGWTREAFGFSIAMQNLIWGLAQPFTGMLADRFGSLRVIVAGLIFYAIGLAWMSVAATPLTFTLSAGLCIGVALSGTSFGVIYGALSRMVPPDRRSWALGLAGAVGGFGQFAMVPLTQGLINLLTWSAHWSPWRSPAPLFCLWPCPCVKAHRQQLSMAQNRRCAKRWRRHSGIGASGC
jgi:MFS family permease